MTTVLLTILIWVMIGRFKRVEVQVVQDDQETTFGIFKKIKILKFNQIAFLVTLLSFIIPSGFKVKSDIDYEFNNSNRKVQNWELKTIVLTIFVDATIVCLCLSFLASLVFQMLSVFRLIRFLATSKVTRVFLSFAALLLSIIYMHEVVEMLVFFWGYPAFKMMSPSKKKKKWINSTQFCIYDFKNY